MAFKIAPYTFTYKINIITQLQNDTINFSEVDVISASGKSVVGKYEGKEIIRAQDGGPSLLLHIGANYKNDSIKKVMDTRDQSVRGKIGNNETVLDDLFLLFSFAQRELRIDSNAQASQSLFAGTLYVIYEGRVDLISNIMTKYIPVVFGQDIYGIKPLNGNRRTLIEAGNMLKKIQAEGVGTFGHKKELFSFSVSRELFEGEDQSIIDQGVSLIEQVSGLIMDLLPNRQDITIKRKVNIDGHKKEVSMDSGLNEYVINNFPQNLILNTQQESLLSGIKTQLINNRSAPISDNVEVTLIKSSIISLINSITPEQFH